MKTDPFSLGNVQMNLRMQCNPALNPAIAALEYMLRKLRFSEPDGFWNAGAFDLWEPKVAPYRALSARRKNWEFLVGHSLRHCANLFSAEPFVVRRLVDEFAADDFTAITKHLPSRLVAQLFAGVF